jgi:hypothetical protein
MDGFEALGTDEDRVGLGEAVGLALRVKKGRRWPIPFPDSRLLQTSVSRAPFVTAWETQMCMLGGAFES